MSFRKSITLAALVACSPAAAPAVDLPPSATGSASAVSVAPLTSGQACKVAWESCRRIVEPVRVSGTEIGQSPRVVWDGREALVTFETLPRTVHLAAVRLDGRMAWNEPLPGKGGHIAWNARTHAGLVMTSEAIVWLGADGKPNGTPAPAPKATNVDFTGAPFATGAGFVLVTGVGGRSSNATIPPLSYAVVGSSPEPITWKTLDTNGDHETPLGASDASDVTSWILSPSRHVPNALYPSSAAGELGRAVPLVLPDGARIATLAAIEKDPLVIYGGTSFELNAVRVRDGQLGQRVSLGIRSQRSTSATVFHIGDALVIGGDKIADSPGAAAARFDPSALTMMGTPLSIGEVDSQSMLVATTDQGFVAVWNVGDEGAPVISLQGGHTMHGLSTKLAVYDCCHH